MVVVDRESEEEARERHYEMRPEDRQASGLILVHIVDPPLAMSPQSTAGAV